MLAFNDYYLYARHWECRTTSTKRVPVLTLAQLSVRKKTMGNNSCVQYRVCNQVERKHGLGRETVKSQPESSDSDTAGVAGICYCGLEFLLFPEELTPPTFLSNHRSFFPPYSAQDQPFRKAYQLFCLLISLSTKFSVLYRVACFEK